MSEQGLLTATNWLFSSLMISPTRTFIHFSFCKLGEHRSTAAQNQTALTCTHIHSMNSHTQNIKTPSFDENLRLAVVDLLVALMSKLRFKRYKRLIISAWEVKEELHTPNRWRETNIVICGILDSCDYQHQHQRHDGCEPGQGGYLWN